jgi:hypothetical protein
MKKNMGHEETHGFLEGLLLAHQLFGVVADPPRMKGLPRNNARVVKTTEDYSEKP